MEDFIGIFKDDWQRIPLNLRYIFFAGVFLIFMAWLGDHWTDQQQYQVLWFASNEITFQVGFFFIVVFFGLLMIKQFWLFGKIFRLRRKYPLHQIDVTFHLVNLKPGWIFLFDERSKKRLHIKTPGTARDLGFVGEWVEPDVSVDAPSDTEIVFRNGTKVKLSDYPPDPHGIYTQGVSAW